MSGTIEEIVAERKQREGEALAIVRAATEGDFLLLQGRLDRHRHTFDNLQKSLQNLSAIEQSRWKSTVLWVGVAAVVSGLLIVWI